MADSPRGIGRSLLLTLPIALWSAPMFLRVWRDPGVAPRLAALLTFVFLVVLFFQMMRTRRTNRWRRVFFASPGFLFPVGFVWKLLRLRVSMSISMEQMLEGNTPFCFLAVPMMLIPAALAGTVLFPGSILPAASNPYSIAAMIGLWLAATLVLGKAWCAYGCWFGGIEEGFAAMPAKSRVRKLSGRWRLVPWAILAAIVSLAAATFAPTCCEWLCPFKAATEYPEVRPLETAVQAGIFLSLFLRSASSTSASAATSASSVCCAATVAPPWRWMRSPLPPARRGSALCTAGVALTPARAAPSSGTSRGRRWAKHTSGPACSICEVDLDGDGKPDLRARFVVPRDPAAKLSVDVEPLGARVKPLRGVG